jgi:hypothetical protein
MFVLSHVVIATPHARRALPYDSLPSFLPPPTGTNAFLLYSCALFAQSAFFVSFVFNHLRTLCVCIFSLTCLFCGACALFAEKQGVPPSISVALFLRRAVRFAPPLPDCKFLHFLYRSSSHPFVFSGLRTLYRKTGGRGIGPSFPHWNAKQGGADGLRRPPLQKQEEQQIRCCVRDDNRCCVEEEGLGDYGRGLVGVGAFGAGRVDCGGDVVVGGGAGHVCIGIAERGDRARVDF